MRHRITNSYSIELPLEVREECDSTVSSYWTEEKRLVLQLSSYSGDDGLRYAASDRLYNHLTKEGRAIHEEISLKVRAPDSASATFIDERGWRRLYSYLVWTDLVIFGTVISSEGTEILDSWAYKAIESIERS
jgi:hypothetical protein